MPKALQIFLVAVISYAIAWTMSYSSIMAVRGDGLDFHFFFEYLAAAWTFRGGELPTFMWLASLVVWLVFMLLVILQFRRARRRLRRG